MPVTTNATIKAAHEEIERGSPQAKGLPADVVAYWVNGVVNQLANLPVQGRIERWIAVNLPDLSKQQRTYLEGDIDQSVAGASQEVERVTPPIIFERSNAMTYAYVRAMGELLDANYTRPYNSYPPVLRKGKELHAMLGAADDETALSDVRLVTDWARSLGLEKWFVWQDFESMPDSYFNDSGSRR